MAAALALAARATGRTAPNPNVGCIMVRDGCVVGRGHTGDGGRPHAEATALAQAGHGANGATAYVTLEPCAHVSARGPDCTGALLAAGVARVVVAMEDPDPRTAGAGIARLRTAGVGVTTGVLAAEARALLAGFAARIATGRPELSLKLALSLDGRLAMADGRSQWITGPVARAFAHRLRASADMVLVGGGTFRADNPELGVRLPGHAGPQPVRAVLTRGAVPPPFVAIPSVAALDGRAGIDRILCEGGGGLAAALLRADRVDRLVLLRAPILLGEGVGIEGFAPPDLAATHGRWLLEDRRPLGPDLLEQYRRTR